MSTVKHIAEAVPASAAAAAPFVGITWSDTAAILGSIFLVLQIAYLIWRWRRDVRQDKK